MDQLVLIIEDDDGIRESIKDLLEFEGYKVKTSRNGFEGFEFLKQNTPLPSLILLDLMMPVMDGWEFLALKSQDPKFVSIPVVVISAAGDRVPVPSAQAFIKKPLHLDNFINVIKGFCPI